MSLKSLIDTVLQSLLEKKSGYEFFEVKLSTRETGKRHPIKYQTSPFFYLHTINAYEDDDHLVIDICCYARYIIVKLFVFSFLLQSSHVELHVP